MEWYICVAYLWRKSYAMRVILNLDESILDKLGEKAALEKRSRKNYMELVLQANAEMAVGVVNKPAQSKKEPEKQFQEVFPPKTNERDKLKSKINFKKPIDVKDCYDGKKLNPYTLDEFGQTSTTNNKPERLKGESSIDYQIRIAEMNQTK